MVSRHTSGHRQFNTYNLFIILAVSLGSASYGFASSAIAPVLALPEFLSYFDLTTRSNGTALQTRPGREEETRWSNGANDEQDVGG